MVTFCYRKTKTLSSKKGERIRGATFIVILSGAPLSA
jgi:hypothetical protein